MSAAPQRPMTRFACIVLAGLALPAGSEVARAAEPQSPDQIIKALKPPVRATRGLTTSPADATGNVEDARFVDTLRKRTTRSLTTEERDKITSIDVLTPEGWGQTLFNVRQELLSSHRAVDRTRCSHAMPTQSGYERDRRPVAVRHTAHQSLAAAATTVQPHHFGIGRSLIDEHQPGQLKHALFSHPALARPCHVRALLLRRAQAFF